MPGMATDLCELMFNHLRGGAAWAQPANLYLAASTADPGADGGGISEPTDAAYARADVTGDFPLVVGRILSNDANIAFPAATASWGTITHVALLDAPAAGNLLWVYRLQTPIPVEIGGILQIDATDLVAELDWVS